MCRCSVRVVPTTIVYQRKFSAQIHEYAYECREYIVHHFIASSYANDAERSESTEQMMTLRSRQIYQLDGNKLRTIRSDNEIVIRNETSAA